MILQGFFSKMCAYQDDGKGAVGDAAVWLISPVGGRPGGEGRREAGRVLGLLSVVGCLWVVVGCREMDADVTELSKDERSAGLRFVRFCG